MTNQINVTASQKKATHIAIRKMAYYAAQGTNQRAKDAQNHCKELGVDWTKPLSS